eukprot:TRINITY_DN1311_c1_g4_i1.p2 TRINITY_DN1311_c1_g4~~TRINITY_DN1311_c1_g4_i1.p2  ORF type:complete len:477 (+),score=176.95 TRINITY_DN1311_c1_g4_i1:101-1531(+)
MSDNEVPEGIDVATAIETGLYPKGVTEETCVAIIDPATKDKLEIPILSLGHTNGLKTYLMNKDKPKRRESFLCMLFQKDRCKSLVRCNQIHADKAFVQKHRESHNLTNEIEPHTDQRQLEVIVDDPFKANSKVVIPFTKTLETKGRASYLELQSNPAGSTEDIISNPFQICPGLLQNKTCCVADGPRACPHIHVPMDFLVFLRRPRACCYYHGDQCGRLDFKGKVFMVNREAQRCPLEPERLIPTAGSKELMQQNTSLLVFNSNRVCRMFLEGKCPFADRCANLHICRKFYAYVIYSRNPQDVVVDPHHAPRHGGARGKNSVAQAADDEEDVSQWTFGIPIVTEEGPVPLDLLPAQAKFSSPLSLSMFGGQGQPGGRQGSGNAGGGGGGVNGGMNPNMMNPMMGPMANMFGGMPEMASMFGGMFGQPGADAQHGAAQEDMKKPKREVMRIKLPGQQPPGKKGGRGHREDTYAEKYV